MCRFDAGPCPGGGPGRGTTEKPQALEAGSCTCHLGPPREARTASRGTPTSGARGPGGPSAKQLRGGTVHHFGPGMGYFLLQFWCAAVLAHWQHRSSEGGGAGGDREGPSPLYCEI